MSDFFKAAFPWVIIGISIAIFAANHAKQKKEKDSDNEDKSAADTRQTEGMCLGMCLGAALGTTGVCEVATGISLGMCLGLAVGSSIKK